MRDDDARGLLDAYRTVHTPDREATVSALARLRARLADAPAEVELDAEAPRGLSRATIAALAIAASIVLTVGIVLLRGALRQRDEAVPDPQATYQGTPASDPEDARVVTPRAEPERGPATDAIAPPEAEPEPALDTDAPREHAEAPPRPRKKPTPTPGDDASLHAEMALLSSAQAALAAGNPERALVELDRHKKRFGASLLAEEREVARIQALCDLGRVEKAAAALKAFIQTFPGSPLTGRAKKACEKVTK